MANDNVLVAVNCTFPLPAPGPIMAPIPGSLIPRPSVAILLDAVAGKTMRLNNPP